MSQRKSVKRLGTLLPIIKVKTENRNTNVAEHLQADEVKLMFAPRRYVVFSRFNNMDQIHIREYEVKAMKAMGQCEYPTKRGVCLTLKRLKMLTNRLQEIDEQLNLQDETPNYKVHLGAGIYASVGALNGVDLRRYWIPEGQLESLPTKSGIFIPIRQWGSLKEKIAELITSNPHLAEAEECFHQNQMELVDCRECLPFGWAM